VRHAARTEQIIDFKNWEKNLVEVKIIRQRREDKILTGLKENKV